MSDLREYIIFLIMQFLAEKNFHEALHWLEQESGCYFNLTYFKELVINGSWTNAQKYLSGFTSADDNVYSRKLFWELGRQKYIDALDRQDYASTHVILFKEFKPLITFREEFPEIEYLSRLDNFRDHENHKNVESSVQERNKLVERIEQLVSTNPCLSNKLKFPDVANNKLKRIFCHREHSLGSTSQDGNLLREAQNMPPSTHNPVHIQMRQALHSAPIHVQGLYDAYMSLGSSSRAGNQTETDPGNHSFRG